MSDPIVASRTHVIAVTISFAVCACMMAIGGALFLAPTFLLQALLRCPQNEGHDETMSALEMSLSRMMGGVFLALSVASGLLLLPSWDLSSRAQQSSFETCRASISCQAVTGLMMVVVGLWNNRHEDPPEGHCRSIQNQFDLYALTTGASFLVLSCLAMMASFWPPKTDDELEVDQGASGQQSCNFICCCRRTRTPLVVRESNDLNQPLLLADDGQDEEAQETNTVQNDIDPVSFQSAADEGATQQVTSRIRGTRRLIKLAAPQVFYLYAGCAVLLIRLPFSLSIPHFVSTTLGALSRNDYDGARREILLLFILGTIDAALDFWCVFLFGYANERIVRGARIDTFASILRQEVNFFDKHTTGELSSRLSSDCGQMAGDLTWFFRFSIESVVRITGITIYMLIRSPLLGGCALCIVPLVAVVNKKYGDWLRKNSIAVQEALAQANSVAQEAFSCVRTVISFAAEDFEHKKYTEKIDRQYDLNIRQLYMSGVYYMAISTFLINTCVQAALLYVGTSLIQRGKLTPEVLLAFMLYQGQLQNETLNLFNSYSSLVKSSGAGDKVFALLDRQPDAPGTGSKNVIVEDIVTSDAASMKHTQSSVRLRNVDFLYPSRPTHTILKGLDLTLSAGSTMALVGPSGCGKSTVVGLLQRFYDPACGEVLIDGVDLRSMDIKAYRRHIGTVTQEPVLFSGSILSNITYGSPSVTMEEAVQAAKLANVHTFVSSFPDGYDTQVGERGVQLSGGQKQRIAIARAIVKNPSLLLLDEATSALDAESEHVVQEALDRLLNANKDMTTVVVAHRLRTVRNADCIAFIENGRVVEKGTHKELMSLRDGHYKKMVERADTDGQLPDK